MSEGMRQSENNRFQIPSYINTVQSSYSGQKTIECKTSLRSSLHSAKFCCKMCNHNVSAQRFADTGVLQPQLHAGCRCSSRDLCHAPQLHQHPQTERHQARAAAKQHKVSFKLTNTFFKKLDPVLHHRHKSPHNLATIHRGL